MSLEDYLDVVRAWHKRNPFYFTRIDDWYNYAPCQTLPRVDPRSLVNCCPLSVLCPVRDAILLSVANKKPTPENLELVWKRFARGRRYLGGIFLRKLRLG